MVVIGQKLFYSGKTSGIPAQNIVLGQKWLYLVKVVVFGQKWLYSGKSGCIRASVVVFGKSGCIRAKWS